MQPVATRQDLDPGAIPMIGMSAAGGAAYGCTTRSTHTCEAPQALRSHARRGSEELQMRLEKKLIDRVLCTHT